MPGWDCHGLPIEWKIEENYRAKGKNKDSVPINEFRRECRAFAERWVGVQAQEFQRLGVIGDWDHPYLTMSFAAEAQIAREIMKFAANGTLYRGSKPVMWSVVEKTALAEAEVEYEDIVSDAVYVSFPLKGDAASVAIWTTTPWTLPGNRAISFSHRITYGRYRVTASPEGNWAKVGAVYIVADKLASEVFKSAKVEAYERIGDVSARFLSRNVCDHPLRKFIELNPPDDYGAAFDFWANMYPPEVPLLDGDHVTDDTGTGFVHTAPSHGRDDFDIWMANQRDLALRGINTRIPYTSRCGWYFHQRSAGIYWPPRHRRQRQQRRRQRGCHQCVDRSRQPTRARKIKAPISAFLALEKASHFPQHAAMVYRARQAPPPRPSPARGEGEPARGEGGDPARDRAARDRRHKMVSARWRKPDHRHDRQSPGLGGLAPTRLGRADCCLRR